MEKEVKAMNKRFIGVLRPLSLSLVLILIVGLAGRGGPYATAAPPNRPPETGLICTTNVSNSFTLTAHDGAISTPDGNIVYMWGFSAGDDAFQHPSPVLCVDEGETVTVVLHNLLTEDVSIIFPGQENVMANGQPSQPQFDGLDLTSLAPVAPPNGTMTYSFVASRPGTFLYQSGTEPLKQVNMGLFGGLVVRPTLGDAHAYNDAGTQFKTEADGDGYRAEYLLFFSEIDPMLHMAVEQGLPYNMNNYTPRYWMINGRSFPDTVAPNGAKWLPDQPYGSLIYIHPYDGVANPNPALIRYINVGTENFPHHPHGNHGRIIAQDSNLLAGDGGQDMSYEKFTINIGPGQTLDELFVWADVEGWSPENPIPVVSPQLQNLKFGTFYSGSPYLGDTDNLPVGHQALNACGEYYHIAHNHALQQITAWGVVLSGHITFTRIDPPLGPDNRCK
jgi:hypothetical protein